MITRSLKQVCLVYQSLRTDVIRKFKMIKAYKVIVTLFVHVVSQVEMRNHRSVIVPNEVIPWRGRHIFPRDASWDGHNTI